MSMNIEHRQRRTEHRFDQRTRGSGTQQTYDLICVGFGTTSLALASALADSKPQARILFIERESQFTWNPEHVLPDKPIGTSFLRDLTTHQNPRSEFTFVNFLVVTNQLVRFTNNSKLAPSRRLMGQYFRWAADRIAQRGWITYGQEAVNVQPVNTNPRNRVTQWTIELRDSKTGGTASVQTGRLVLATGASPSLMGPLLGPQLEPLILHTSYSAGLLEKLGGLKLTLNIAVVGADQEATELFHHLHTAQGKHTATMFYADSALRPDDHSPSIQDMLEKPESTHGSLPPELRQRMQSVQIHQSPKVDLQTLESLYEAQYTQKIHEPDASKWRFQMRPLSEVVAGRREQDKVRLVTRNPRTGEVTTSAIAYDVVIAGGYEASSSSKLCKAVAPLLDGGALSVDSTYKVNFRRDVLARGCSMWLLGSLQDATTRGDDFSVLSERARRTRDSVLLSLKEKSDEQYSEVAVL